VYDIVFENKKEIYKLEGILVNEPRLDYVSQYNNRLTYIVLNKKAGLINLKGKIIVPIFMNLIERQYLHKSR